MRYLSAARAATSGPLTWRQDTPSGPLTALTSSLGVTVTGDLDYSSDGKWVSMVYAPGTQYDFYERVGGSHTLRTRPASVNSLGRGTAWHSNTINSVNTTSSFNKLYPFKRTGSTWAFTGPIGVAPGGIPSPRAVAWGGSYLAVGTDGTPFVNLYKLADNPTKLTNPASLPWGTVTAVAWSPNGDYLVCGLGLSGASPNLIVYSRATDTFTKLADPASQPAQAVVSLAMTPNGDYLIVACAAPPYLLVYSHSSGTLTRLTDPASQPAAAVSDLALTPDDNGAQLAVALAAAPYLALYSHSSGTLTQLTSPTPAGALVAVAWTPDIPPVALSATPSTTTVTSPVALLAVRAGTVLLSGSAALSSSTQPTILRLALHLPPTTVTLLPTSPPASLAVAQPTILLLSGLATLTLTSPPTPLPVARRLSAAAPPIPLTTAASARLTVTSPSELSASTLLTCLSPPALLTLARSLAAVSTTALSSPPALLHLSIPLPHSRSPSPSPPSSSPHAHPRPDPPLRPLDHRPLLPPSHPHLPVRRLLSAPPTHLATTSPPAPLACLISLSGPPLPPPTTLTVSPLTPPPPLVTLLAAIPLTAASSSTLTSAPASLLLVTPLTAAPAVITTTPPVTLTLTAPPAPLHVSTLIIRPHLSGLDPDLLDLMPATILVERKLTEDFYGTETYSPPTPYRARVRYHNRYVRNLQGEETMVSGQVTIAGISGVTSDDRITLPAPGTLTATRAGIPPDEDGPHSPLIMGVSRAQDEAGDHHETVVFQ